MPKPKAEHKPLSPRLQLRRVRLESLRPDPDNARTHNEANLSAIKGSLDAFGQVEPLVVQKGTGRIIAGHGRLEALTRQGETEADIVEVDVDDQKATAMAIALNHTGELAGWDMPKLAQVLQSLPEDLLPATGYDAGQLTDILAEINPPTIIEDEPPEPAPEAITARGDLWLLGNHRLLCGDSTHLQDVQRVMDGQKAALVATDPPYLVDYTGDRPGFDKKERKNTNRGKDWSHVYHEVDIPDADRFFTALFTNVLAVLGAHAAIYCWHAHRRVGEIQRIWRDLGILDHQEIVWVKPSSVFGRVYWHFRHEPCIMGWKQGSKPAHDGLFEATSVWSDAGRDQPLDAFSKEQLVEMIKQASSIWEIDWEGKSRVVGNEHPTQKPVEIFARPMRKHTKPGDICFEPFSGSCTQLSAGEQLGRRVYAIELEPVFVDVAIRRWQTLTGKAATHSETGRTWEQTAQDRDKQRVTKQRVGIKDKKPKPAKPAAKPAKPAATAK